MLASDSDSDFEYTSAGVKDSGSYSEEGSSEDGVLHGKLALGVDPQDMKAYDGRSTPQNGSQYLMKVMAEKKGVPKVVSVDSAALAGRKVKRVETEGAQCGPPHYLDKFLKVCDGGNGEAGDSNMLSFLPSAKWREETVSCFSLMRSRIEKWQYKFEAKEIRISDRVKFPQSNDHTHWVKFCFGDAFLKLVAGSKSKSKEQKLSDFFLDMYDAKVTATVLESVPAATEKLPESASADGPSEDESSDPNASQSNPPSDTLEESKPEEKLPQTGNRPLMNLVLQLNHCQLEKLVKWNLLWVQSFGFVNECQGQWLYAVLACLFKPVDPSIMSDLRSIVRVLIERRGLFSKEWGAYFQEGNRNDSDDRYVCDERVFDYINTLNLFIYIVADYFKNADLVMKV